eukprot:COSAG06_NODE_4128_length_4540_cov_14.432785_3_plen_50_part_00
MPVAALMLHFASLGNVQLAPAVVHDRVTGKRTAEARTFPLLVRSLACAC